MFKISEEDLRRIIRLVIREELRWISLQKAHHPNDLLDTHEAAYYLHVSVSKMRKLVQGGKLNPINKNSRPHLFRRFMLDEYLLSA